MSRKEATWWEESEMSSKKLVNCYTNMSPRIMRVLYYSSNVKAGRTIKWIIRRTICKYACNHRKGISAGIHFAHLLSLTFFVLFVHGHLYTHRRIILLDELSLMVLHLTRTFKHSSSRLIVHLLPVFKCTPITLAKCSKCVLIWSSQMSILFWHFLFGQILVQSKYLHRTFTAKSSLRYET